MRRPRRLTAAERRIWDAFPAGEWVDLRTGDPELDDPAKSAEWPREREVRAEILRALLLGAVERQPGQVPAVRLAGARITGTLDLSEGSVSSTLHLLNCHLPEALDLTDAGTRSIRLRGCDLLRLRGSRAKIDGLLELDASTVREGVRLDNARIEGQFRMNRSTVHAPPRRERMSESGVEDVLDPSVPALASPFAWVQQEWALWAGGLSVGGGVFLRSLRARGGLRLIGAVLPGGLYLQGATVEATGVYAVHADFITAGTIEMSAGFRAEGTVRLRSATVAGVLSFDGADLRPGEHRHTSRERDDQPVDRALHLSHSTVDELIWLPAAIEGEVNLRYSRIGVLLDHPAAYTDRVQLNGLTYESVRGLWSVAERVSWLARDPTGYRPQPYEQLAGWYRRIGHEPDARRVLLAKQRRRRETLRPMGRGVGRLLDLVVGYGYRSWLAGLWAVVLLGFGTAVFARVPPVKVDPDEQRTFHAFVYTLDLLVPVSVFEVRGAWEPVGWTQWVAWGLIVSGWVLATALIAGAARVLRPASGP
ncbi:hypothetical protein [Nonomuraea sp. NPDC050310]|uniref:hypothetical protein n=1 Tax=Nonomuraea sp. NPDC050310 TaxID=3154935 RepID=UPI0033E2115D